MKTGRVILALLAANCLVLAATVGGNWDIVNNTGVWANDFHMDFWTDTTLTPKTFYTGAFSAAGCSAPGASVSCNWWDGWVAPGQMTHVGVYFDEPVYNRLRISDAYWTLDGAKLDGSVYMPGMDFWPPGGSWPGGPYMPRWRFFNPWGDPLYIGGASMQVVGSVPALSSLMYLTGGRGTPVNDFVIPADSFFDVYMDIPIWDGAFAIFQGRAYLDPGRTQLVGNFVYGHEHVPEPGTGVLVLAGLFLGVAVRRRWRQAR